MKKLSMSQANRCENAAHSRCRCRCKGELHGAGRGHTENFFRLLNSDDPHHAVPKAMSLSFKKRQMDLFEGARRT